MARADASEMRNSGPKSRPTNLWRGRATFINTSTREARRGVGFCTAALLIPSDARSKLRCDGEWMASVPIPKFASLRGTRVCELWNAKGH